MVLPWAIGGSGFVGLSPVSPVREDVCVAVGARVNPLKQVERPDGPGGTRQTPFWRVGYQGSPGIGLRLGDHRDHIKWTHTLAVSTSRAVLGIVQLCMLASHAIGIFGDEPQYVRRTGGNAAAASGTPWRGNVWE